jgi:hypothetical protein
VLHLDLDTPATKGSLHITDKFHLPKPQRRSINKTQNWKTPLRNSKKQRGFGRVQTMLDCHKLFIYKNLNRLFYELLNEHRKNSFLKEIPVVTTIKPDFPQE